MASLRFAVFVLMARVAAADQDTPTQYSTKRNTLEEKEQIAAQGCGHVPQNTVCRMSCLYKSIGVIDGSGRYIESAAADLMTINIPENTRDDAAVKRAVKACNSVNDHIVEGCGRALQVDECLTSAYDKITNEESRAAMAADAKLICINKDDVCHRSCVFNTFRLVDNRGLFDSGAAVDFLAVTYPELNINKLDTIAEICGDRVGNTLDGCENAVTLWNCFKEEYQKETGKQT